MDNISPDAAFTLAQSSQTESARALKNLDRAAAQKDMKQIDKSAVDFEAVFIAEMMKPMFEGIGTEAPFGGGRGEEVFRSLMLQEYGKLIAQTGSIGVADHVRTEMLRIQEQQAKAAEARQIEQTIKAQPLTEEQIYDVSTSYE